MAAGEESKKEEGNDLASLSTFFDLYETTVESGSSVRISGKMTGRIMIYIGDHQIKNLSDARCRCW